MTEQVRAEAQRASRAGQGPPWPELHWSQRPGHDRTGVEAHLAAFVGIDSLHHRAPVDELVLPDPARTRQYLEEGWRVPDVRQLRAQILDLLWRGQSQKFATERETWSRLDPEAASAIEAELRLAAADGDPFAREKLRVSRRHWASLPEPISTRFDAKTDAELDLLRTDSASPWMTIPWFAPFPDPEYLVLDAFVADNPPAQDQVVPTQPTDGRPSRWRERFVQAFGARLEDAQK